MERLYIAPGDILSKGMIPATNHGGENRMVKKKKKKRKNKVRMSSEIKKGTTYESEGHVLTSS